MSDLSLVQLTQFSSVVKAEYAQKNSKLRDTVRLRVSTPGEIVQFPKVGSLQMQEAGFRQNVQFQDPGYTKVTTTMKKYNAVTPVDRIESITVNFDDKREVAMLAAEAARRQVDQLIINAISASGTANTIASGGTNLNFEKINETIRFFDDLNVPQENRHIMIPAAGAKFLRSVAQFTNNELVNKGLVQTGSLDEMFNMSLKFHVIGSMKEGGIPDGTTPPEERFFAWDKMSTGLAMGQDITTLIERRADIDSWQVMVSLFASAVAIDNVGIVSGEFDPTSAT